MKTDTIITIIVVISASMQWGCEAQCQYPCICNKRSKSATCNSRHLTFIPRLPSYVITVKLVENHFNHISRDFFANLTSYDMHVNTLNLTDNRILFIDLDAFQDFRDLTSLEVSKEPKLNISALINSFGSLPVRTMSFLQFFGNGWEKLPLDMFQAFSGNIRRSFNVSLIRNRLQTIDSRVFQPIKNLAKLNLGWNRIKNLTLDGFLNVKELNLNGNFIQDIPAWCGPDKTTLVPKLLLLRLDDNSIAEMDQNSFKCLQNLEKLGMNANNFRTLQSNTFSELHNLKKLYIAQNTRLHTIEPFAFNCSSLQVLNFTQNSFQFNKGIYHSYNPKTLFKYCPNLERLYLSFNTLPTRGQYDIFRTIFRPLVKLRSLYMEGCAIRSMPYYTFQTMKQLEVLNLKSNILQGWNYSDRVFGNHSSLKYLSLRSNFIRLVNQTTFPPSLLKSLNLLDLGNNYYSCTCDQMWFRDWIRRNAESGNKGLNLTLVGYPRYYKCKLPGDMRDVLLQDYNPTVESCREKNPWVITAISLVSLGVFAAVVFLIFYKCQTNIKNYIYLCRFYKNRKSGYIRLESDEDYEYHAFIVYCEADSEWVHNVCVKRLEMNEGMKVCFHQRDFDVGESVTGNIEKYMSRCRKIIVVMSNNFAESEWCQWEIDLVHERRRKQGKDVALLVMLKSIDSKHMTNRLKALIESTPYLTYCTGVGEKIFWKTLIESLRKPFGHPPTAVV